MLGAWTEILPMFVVRWLARKYCKRAVAIKRNRQTIRFYTVRPDILIKETNK